MHPFVDAQSHAVTEHQLRQVLLRSASLDGYLAALIAAGHDLAGEGKPTLGRGYRILEWRARDAVVGVAWNDSGRFAHPRATTSDQIYFSYALLTAYREDHADELLTALRQSRTFEDLRARLKERGYRLVPLA